LSSLPRWKAWFTRVLRVFYVVIRDLHLKLHRKRGRVSCMLAALYRVPTALYRVLEALCHDLHPGVIRFG